MRRAPATLLTFMLCQLEDRNNRAGNPTAELQEAWTCFRPCAEPRFGEANGRMPWNHTSLS